MSKRHGLKRFFCKKLTQYYQGCFFISLFYLFNHVSSSYGCVTAATVSQTRGIWWKWKIVFTLSWIKRKQCFTAIAVGLVSKWKRGNKDVTDIFSPCDACVCPVGVTYIHSHLSAVTLHEIIYNSARRPSRHTDGFPTYNAGVERQLPASNACLHPCMPVHGHACTHTGDDTCQLPDECPQAGWRDVADADLCLTPIFNATFPPPPHICRCLSTDNKVSACVTIITNNSDNNDISFLPLLRAFHFFRCHAAPSAKAF